MYPYMNEDAMWQRLKDIQLEMENSRNFADAHRPGVLALVRWLGARAWWLAGLATRRPPRRSPRVAAAEAQDYDTEVA